MQLILVSDARTADLREALRHIYNNIYVEYVVKNPLSVPGQPFRSVHAYVNKPCAVMAANMFLQPSITDAYLRYLDIVERL